MRSKVTSRDQYSWGTKARITLTLPAACDDEDAVQAVLTGFLLTVCSLRDNYPEYIEVMEV